MLSIEPIYLLVENDKGVDDNLIVYLANCISDSMQIQNEDEFIDDIKKIAAKRR